MFRSDDLFFMLRIFHRSHSVLVRSMCVGFDVYVVSQSEPHRASIIYFVVLRTNKTTGKIRKLKVNTKWYKSKTNMLYIWIPYVH